MVMVECSLRSLRTVDSHVVFGFWLTVCPVETLIYQVKTASSLYSRLQKSINYEIFNRYSTTARRI